MLVACDISGSRKVASESLKGGEFVCPDCRQDVQIRTGLKRVAHFAHLVGQECTEAKKEAAKRRGKLRRAKKNLKEHELLGQQSLFSPEELLA